MTVFPQGYLKVVEAERLLNSPGLSLRVGETLAVSLLPPWMETQVVHGIICTGNIQKLKQRNRNAYKHCITTQ